MTPDTADTIVAIATARGSSPRGVVRLSGPTALATAARLTVEPLAATKPTRLTGHRLRVSLDGDERLLPADVYVWPNQRSYTHQPSVEFHTVGSPPVLDALVTACLGAGARLAEPGEFTVRAFLAGRLDLTQAEAVLSVIDAPNNAALDSALDRLAGGLSTPLHRLRADLLGLLADLEAGLDFVEEEDVRFVEPAELRRRLREAAEIVAATRAQIASRDESARLARVAIVGPPNVGKSRLFNALVARHGADEQPTEALVADVAGVTRDAVAARLDVDGVAFELVDSAGADEGEAVDTIDAVARGRVQALRDQADLLIECRQLSDATFPAEAGDRLWVGTMSDRFEDTPPPAGWIATSAATGAGLPELASRIASRLAGIEAGSTASYTASTAQRCRAGLDSAAEALERATQIADTDAGEELVALELRQALDGLGRVVGEVVTDDVLGEIFGKFCIGK